MCSGEKPDPGHRSRLEAYELDSGNLDLKGVIDDRCRSRAQIVGFELVGQLTTVHEDKRDRTACEKANRRGMKGELYHLDPNDERRFRLDAERHEGERREEEESQPSGPGGEHGDSPPGSTLPTRH